MANDFLPKRRLGMLYPLSTMDNLPYEFYKIVREDVMLVCSNILLEKFSAQDVERVFASMDPLVDAMCDRGVDLVMQSGVPLPLLIGVKAHDAMVERLRARSGKPATSSVIGVVNAALRLRIKNIAMANKWRPDMNDVLAQFFQRDGISVAGVASEPMDPSRFQKMGAEEGFDLALELGRAALIKYPAADGLYIGGGSWMISSLVDQLEQEFGKPVITNQNASIWNALQIVDFWKPIPRYGRLLALE